MKIRFSVDCDCQQVYGGMKQIYRFIDVLNQLGYDAALLVHSTRVMEAKDEVLESSDYLVLGECAGGIPDITGADKASLVIYAQNPYTVLVGFGGVSVNVLKFYRERVKAVTCISEHSRQILSWMLKTDIYRTRYSFDREPFSYSDSKEELISFMPRKRSEDISKTFHVLDAKGYMGWRLGEIARMSESESADIMKRSSIFVSASSMEGFGMPPAEAMACGCVVVGFNGIAGAEFMDKGIMWNVPDGDFLGVSKAIHEVMMLTGEERRRIGVAASDYIRSQYSTELEVASVGEAWERIIG